LEINCRHHHRQGRRARPVLRRADIAFEADTCASVGAGFLRVYPNCRRSPLFLSVCDKPNSSEANKKDRGFFAGKLEPVHAKRQAHDFDSPHLSCL
jgi:hypothetical protein